MADYKTNGTTTTTHKLTQKEKFKKHWKFHLIFFIISTITISMLLNYVMLPAIAQHDVNTSELFTEEQTVTNPRPNVVHIKMRNKAINHSLFTPTLDKFNASLFLEATEPNIKPFGYITIPSVHATKVSYTDVDQELEIADMDQFIAYNTLVTTSKEFRVAVRGRTKLHLGALPVVTVNYNKAITMKGLNGLQGLSVDNVTLTMTTFDDGSNMHGTVHIPNPSVMTLQIGDIVQDLFVDGKTIGNTTIKGVTLAPGNNSFPVMSTTNQAALIPLLGPGKKFPTGVLEIEARTREISYEGQMIPYFAEAMKHAPVKFSMDIGPQLRKLGLGAVLDGPKAVSSSAPAPSATPSAPASAEK